MVDHDTGLGLVEHAPRQTNMRPRLNDLNPSGEFVYTSAGMWMYSMRDPKLILAGCHVISEWAIQCQRFSPRHVCTGMIPMLSVETVVSAVSEVERTAEVGFEIAMLTLRGPSMGRTCTGATGAYYGSDGRDRYARSIARGQRTLRGRHLEQQLPRGPRRPPEEL